MVDGFHEADGDVDALIDDIHREWREHEAKAVPEDRYMDENGVGALQTEGPVKTDALKNTFVPSVSAPKAVPHKSLIQTATCTLPIVGGSMSTTVNDGTKKRKKKSVGNFKHSSRNLKRLARMLAKDRLEILKILKKQAKERKARILARSKSKDMVTSTTPKVTSSTCISSVNKYWEH